MSPRREQDVTEAFVTLASSLANGADVVDMLSGLVSDCAALLDVASAGLLLADPLGVLHVMAASSEQTWQVEVFQVQRDEGPCRDCHVSGEAVLAADLQEALVRWPRFVPIALEAGFVSVHTVPMRLRGQTIGALGLFGTSTGELGEEDLRLAQAMADVASVALVQNQAVLDQFAVVTQLQTALNSRIVLEQAKGVLSHVGNLDMGQAFAVLRRYARDHNERLTDVATALVGRQLTAQVLLEHARHSR